MTRAAALAALVSLAVALPCAAAAPPRLDELLERQAERLAAHPDEPGSHNDMGNLLLQDGRAEAAREAYRRALELEPSFTPAWYNLGLLELERGALRDAEERFSRVLEIDPGHALAHYRLGDVDAARDRNRKAVRHYADAFRLDRSLAVPGRNPEVLSNRLAGWAKLRVYLSPAPGLKPRQYHDPAPLAQVIVGDLGELEAAAGETVAEPMTGAEEAADDDDAAEAEGEDGG